MTLTTNSQLYKEINNTIQNCKWLVLVHKIDIRIYIHILTTATKHIANLFKNYKQKKIHFEITEILK